MEGDIKSFWASKSGVNEMDAKFEYVSICTNLPTYGVQYFVCEVGNPAGNQESS